MENYQGKKSEKRGTKGKGGEGREEEAAEGEETIEENAGRVWLEECHGASDLEHSGPAQGCDRYMMSGRHTQGDR